MSNNNFLLITEREPIVYLEHAKLMLKDGFLIAYYADCTHEIIPVATTMLIMLGAGTSITQGAAIFCANNNLFLCFARGGSFIHSVWQGKWQAPEKLVRQVLLHNNCEERLRIAKKILSFKLLKSNVDDLSEITGLDNVQDLLLFEARQAKATYRQLAADYNVGDFKRERESYLGINSSITLLSNAMYTYCTAISLQFGFNPSVGFIHGQTRRGGLAFDLADIFKYNLCLVPAFCKRNTAPKEVIMDFSNDLRKNNFRVVREMIHFLRYIAGEINEEEVDKILDEHSCF